ncbi:hypothetical protein HID58_056320 [Brassica napus]|uniref:Uncharacterized protein n=1 Tax=Brassica napus TaxID=3708 RepID=A0ABQ8AMW2_BRANA|nr:hypothetical protein HID58_056320 [Brassica napus]
MANYFFMGLVGPLRPITVTRDSFNQTSKKPKKVNSLRYLHPFLSQLYLLILWSEKLLMAPLTLSVDVKSSSASAPDVSSRVIQIPQIKKSKGFASVSTQNENENPFDFFRTLFGMEPLCSVSLLAQGFIAGGTAGVVVETALYPIDTIKTRLQASSSWRWKDCAEGSIFRISWKYRWCLTVSALIHSVPILASALFVGVYEPTKQKLLKTFPDHLSAVAHLTAGAIGGLAASLIRVPTEVVKQRMQTGQFASAPNAVRVIASQEGFKGLYAGYRSFLLRDLPFDAIQFCIYEQLCLGYKKAARRELNDPENALIGAFAGALTGAVTTPLDVIKTRLMVQGSAKQYQGIVDCVQTIVKEEGASALLKGIGPRVLWIGIGGSIFFGVLESTKRTLAQRRPKTVKESKED